MRAYIFAICTLLSSFGFIEGFLFFAAAGQCVGNRHDSCSAGLDTGWLLIVYLAYIAIFFYAWIAYFTMGAAWVLDRRLGFFWPMSGTLAAILALNGVGLGMGHGMGPHLVLMENGSIVTFPAMLLAIWMAVFHIRHIDGQTS